MRPLSLIEKLSFFQYLIYPNLYAYKTVTP